MVNMLLNFLLWINKRKLDRMITQGESYKEILKQSQKLDIYINIWIKNWVSFKGINAMLLKKYKK